MKNKKIIFITIIGFVIIGLIFLISSLSKNTDDSQDAGNTDGVVEDVEYYAFRSNPTELQKELDLELEETIENEGFINENVARLVAESFYVDFYTLSNKTIKNDIGGAQFLPTMYRLNFREKAINSTYLYLEAYQDEYGASELPTVINVKSTSASEVESFEEFTLFIEVEWEYDNLSYDTSDMPTSGAVVITEHEGKMYIIEIY